MGTGIRHIDRFKTEFLLGNSAGNTTTLWLDLQKYSHVALFILATTTSTPTGAAVTVNQAQDTAGTGSKALTYNNYFLATAGFGTQAATADVWTQTTGVSGTFTTGNTANTNLAYAIEIQDVDLDIANAFRTVQLSLASGAVNTTFTVIAHCTPRYQSGFDTLQSALV